MQKSIILGIIYFGIVSCNEFTNEAEPDFLSCNAKSGLTIIHLISLQGCYACGSALNVPAEYGELLARNCSYVIANHSVPGYERVLKGHLPERILQQSDVSAQPDLYNKLKKTYMPDASSFILIFENDSLVFQTVIDREGIRVVYDLLATTDQAARRK